MGTLLECFHCIFYFQLNIPAADLKFSLENNEDVGLEGDIENVCFEIKNVMTAI